MGKRLFVTVGTTKFPELIRKVTSTEILNILKGDNFTFMQIQTGRDYTLDIPAELRQFLKERDGSIYLEFDNFAVKYDSFFPKFEEEITKYDLIISHAGAGTCLEVLRKRIPLIVVINENLMENHQAELAEQLQSEGYVYCCTCDTLNEAIQKDFKHLKPYNLPVKGLFSKYLDKCMGFV